MLISSNLPVAIGSREDVAFDFFLCEKNFPTATAASTDAVRPITGIQAEVRRKMKSLTSSYKAG